jgi:hypothetical protein
MQKKEGDYTEGRRSKARFTSSSLFWWRKVVWWTSYEWAFNASQVWGVIWWWWQAGVYTSLVIQYCCPVTKSISWKYTAYNNAWSWCSHHRFLSKWWSKRPLHAFSIARDATGPSSQDTNQGRAWSIKAELKHHCIGWWRRKACTLSAYYNLFGPFDILLVISVET